jgi:hypothetical protein
MDGRSGRRLQARRRVPVVRLAVGWFGLAALVPGFAAGQGVAQDTARRDTTVYRGNAIVVTATRSPRKVFVTPAPVVVIDTTSLVRTQANTVTDVFRDLPGLDVNGVGVQQPRPLQPVHQSVRRVIPDRRGRHLGGPFQSEGDDAAPHDREHPDRGRSAAARHRWQRDPLRPRRGALRHGAVRAAPDPGGVPVERLAGAGPRGEGGGARSDRGGRARHLTGRISPGVRRFRRPPSAPRGNPGRGPG